MLRLIFPAAASFGLTLLAIYALRPLAIAVDLVDRPGGRKTHHGVVPIVGGLAMLLGVILGSGLLPANNSIAAFLAACSLLVTVGLIDDRFEISPWARLPVQVAAALIVMFGAGTMATTLGDPFGVGPIWLNEYGSPLFTMMVIIAAINACNMLDGMDGLAGATSLISLLALGIISGADGSAAVSVIVASSVCAFLLFNFPTERNRRMRCFMGDAGSTLLGFCVAWLVIEISQDPAREASTVTMLWIVALPLYELIWTTMRRIVRGVSPFEADNEHFHHLLLKAGFGVRGAFGIFVGLAALFAGFGMLAHYARLHDPYSFLLLVLLGPVVVRLMYRAEILWKIVPAAWRRERRLVVEAASGDGGTPG